MKIYELIAKRDIVGCQWTIAKGRRLMGKKEAKGWFVWLRSDPNAHMGIVPHDYVRVVLPKAVKDERKAMSAWCAPGQSIKEMLAMAAERD